MGLTHTPPRNSAVAPHNKRNKPDSSAEKDNSVSIKIKERKISTTEPISDVSVIKLPQKPKKLPIEGKDPTAPSNLDESKGNLKPGIDPATDKIDPVSLINSKEYREKYCGKCNVPLTSDDEFLSCSCCTRRFHTDCLELTSEESAAFTLLKDKAHFYCDSCEIGAKDLYLQALTLNKRMNTIDEQLCNMKSEQGGMKSDIYNLQVTTDKNCDDIDTLLVDVSALESKSESQDADIQRIDKDTKKVIADHRTTVTSVANLTSKVNNYQSTINDIETIKSDVKTNKDEVENLKASLLDTLRIEMKQEVDKQVKAQNLITFPVLPNTDGAMETNQDQPSQNQIMFREFVNNTVAEREEIMKRKYQLVIFNLKEVNSAEDDKKQTQELFKLLNIEDEIKIEELIRMGKTQADKPRMIRVTFSDLATKRKVLAKAPTLRNVPQDSNFAKVYIRPNLTAQQLQDSKNLQEELRVRRLQDPTKHLKIQKGKIVVVPENQ